MAAETLAQVTGDPGHSRGDRGWSSDRNFFWVYASVRTQNTFRYFFRVADRQQYSGGRDRWHAARYYPAVHAGHLSVGVQRGLLAAERAASLASASASDALGGRRLAPLDHFLHGGQTAIGGWLSVRRTHRARFVFHYAGNCCAAPAQETRPSTPGRA